MENQSERPHFTVCLCGSTEVVWYLALGWYSNKLYKFWCVFPFHLKFELCCAWSGVHTSVLSHSKNWSILGGKQRGKVKTLVQEYALFYVNFLSNFCQFTWFNKPINQYYQLSLNRHFVFIVHLYRCCVLHHYGQMILRSKVENKIAHRKITLVYLLDLGLQATGACWELIQGRSHVRSLHGS